MAEKVVMKPVEVIANIKGITVDSRQVRPGYLFAAFKGSQTDGRNFIPAAIEKGARFILAETGTNLPSGVLGKVELITHDNPRLFFAQLVATFYHNQPETIVAVTGTNGKTSTAYFCQQLWNYLEKPAVSIGTIGICGKGHPFDPGDSLTTPDTVTLHQQLSALEVEGIRAVAMEASSHGLDQYRLDGLRICAAGFTNLTRDHLDYHHTFQDYFNAKLRLFTDILPSGGAAVLNADIPEYQALVKACNPGANHDLPHHTIIDYGKQAKVLKLQSITLNGYGQQVVMEHQGKTYRLDLALIGEFQVYNALCAAGLLMGSGMDAHRVIPALATLQPAPGRMELVPGSAESQKAVFVDYAHTPDALEKALQQLRPYVKGKLIVVFGCGGDRDKGKRPEMGKIAATLADQVVVTDDNPRTENPEVIRKEVLVGCQGAMEIGDRKQAISQTISKMRKGDVLLIAGKGHEKTQKIGKEAFPFDDVAVAKETLASE